MVQKIKDIAFAVVDAFAKKIPLNDSIIAVSDSIDNDEILKRICELVNQNVYLSIFHTPGVDRSNIVFDIADYEKIRSEIKRKKLAMDDYTVGPDSFTNAISHDEPVTQPTVVLVEKTAQLNNSYSNTQDLGVINRLTRFIGMIKSSELKSIESNFSQILKDSKVMVSRGESIGDMAKLASRNVSDSGMNPSKTMLVYDEVAKALSSDGYKVSTEFTKTSSMKIDKDAPVLKPSYELALSLEKIAALDEMLGNINLVTRCYERVTK